jgi:fengycin family lipopeptide synthetase D
MIFTRLQQHAARTPHQPAVVHAGRRLSWRGLEAQATRIAQAIVEAGRRRERANGDALIVGVMCDHGADMIAAVLGALRAGAIHVPLDPRYPATRLAAMIAHAGCDAILMTSNVAPAVAAATTDLPGLALPPQLIVLDTLVPGDARGARGAVDTAGDAAGDAAGALNVRDVSADTPLPPEPTPDQPAYILYTSGSTGTPKGIVQSHGHLASFADAWVAAAGLTHRDRVALVSSLSHDAAIPDVYGAISSGAALYPFDLRAAARFGEVADWLAREHISVWHSVPTVFRRLMDSIEPAHRFPDLRLIALGGEAVRASDLDIARRSVPRAEIAIIYGQSESTINTIWKMSAGADDAPITLGTPIAGTRVFLADDEGVIVEGLGTGEVVVASEHVALGYWRDPEQSARAFTSDPELGRLYWTGDRGRLGGDGAITLLGRVDAQVKIRGHRVEPAEIEAVLLRQPGIVHAAVVATPARIGATAFDLDLHAVVVSREPIDGSTLKRAVADLLPDHMTPRWISQVDDLPSLPNGKIDRVALAALPAPKDTPAAAFVPRTETEAKVAAVWKGLLGADDIGANADFFDLGGHSLAVMDLLSEVHDVFNTDLNFKDVLQHRTIEQFAKLIDGAQPNARLPLVRAERRDYYPLSSAQTRMFVLSHHERVGTTYNMPIAVDLQGTFDRERFRRAVAALITRHESLRTSFHLVGGTPVQVVHDADACDLDRVVDEIVVTDEADVEREIRAFVRPFDLAQAPLLRFRVLARPDAPITLLSDIPHIVCDGLSRDLMIRDLVSAYAGEVLPPLSLQYTDYAVWQDRLRRSGLLADQEHYWRERLAGDLPRLALPTDFERPALFSFAGATAARALASEEAIRFREMAAQSPRWRTATCSSRTSSTR